MRPIPSASRTRSTPPTPPLPALALIVLAACGSPDKATPTPALTEPAPTSPPSTTPPPAPDTAPLPTDSAGTDTGPTQTIDPCLSVGTGTFTGPIAIDSVLVECNQGNDHVRYLACVQGLTSGGRVFTQETGNPEPNWSDDHTLDTIASDPLGWYDEIERRLETAVSITDWEPDVSTLFGCQAHFEAPQIMSYALMVTDAAGNLADCVAWGDDPQGMIDGAVDRVNEPPFDLTACRIW